ncbi:hypothetical protein [Pseudomonas brenneri]|uniref:hypothetical protein n=1 Tax=Pseudomonas brenneri TaxID=129817 RepID=UPI003BA05F85
MSMKMIRQTLGIPAKCGQRVRFALGCSATRLGTIRSADGGTLYVQLDGEGFTRGLHLTLGLEYLGT